jgi:glycerol uptake facilitator-like aquaporin
VRRSTARAVLAEFLGAGALSVGVVGSGIAADRMTTDGGLALLINALSTAAVLFVIIATLRSVSGAHINPVISVADAITGGIGWRTVALYVPAQIIGFVTGVALANGMFGRPLLELSNDDRFTVGAFIGEMVATAGLIVVVFAAAERSSTLVGAIVAAYIGAAYFFTSSTSFANPGITVGRMFTSSYSGIAPASGLEFIVAQVLGGSIGLGIAVALRPRRAAQPEHS